MNKKICFLANFNLVRGSFRVHVRDLNLYLNQINVNSVINPSNINDYDIIIIDKALLNNIVTYREKYKNKILIGITPSRNWNYHKYLDYAIVGSIEEKNSIIEYYKKIFILPQIESMYFNKNTKIHKHKDKITIGYHGNSVHLNSLVNGCCQALEKLSKETQIELLVFKSQLASNTYWTEGVPKINIKYKQWNLNTIATDLLDIDIGIVPYFSESKNNLSNDTTKGKYNTDYMLRFKNKSNPGRCLVFYQLKIPVIADMVPSNMYILNNTDNGYAVCGEAGWYNAFKELLDVKKREFISDNAYNDFKEKYNPLEWTKKFITELSNDLNMLS